jgi:hypothetical protein
MSNERNCRSHNRRQKAQVENKDFRRSETAVLILRVGEGLRKGLARQPARPRDMLPLWLLPTVIQPSLPSSSPSLFLFLRKNNPLIFLPSWDIVEFRRTHSQHPYCQLSGWLMTFLFASSDFFT